MTAAGIALIVGGAVGNLIDRLITGRSRSGLPLGKAKP
ncbi:MAG: hypothetical protein P8Y25_01035 [Chromatiaceae bacterium]